MSPHRALAVSLLVLWAGGAQECAGASLLERSYEYVRGVAAAYAPNFLSLASCVAEQDAWACARDKAAKVLDVWEGEVAQQRRSWGVAADREMARAAGRAAAAADAAGAVPLPSRVAGDLETSLQSLADLVQTSLARAMARKKGGSGLDITLSTTSEKKKKMKKKKKKPQKIQIVQAHPHMMMMLKKKEQGRQLTDVRKIPVQAWVVGHPESHEKDGATPTERPARVARAAGDWTPVAGTRGGGELGTETHRAAGEGRGILDDAWRVGEHVNEMLATGGGMEEDDEGGSSGEGDELREVGEQRGKKKKKKKAILKLLLLGAVAKAKIGLLLQLLSAHLQVKFFAIALAGLAINIARFWLDLKKGGQPQKVIYYEHAQHQHHYEHEDEGWGGGGGGGGYWSRSLDEPKEQENIYPAIETEHDEPEHAPYRAYSRRAVPSGRSASLVAR